MATVTYIETTDGEQLADVDVSTLTRKEAHDLRLELREELLKSEEDLSEEVRDFYEKKLKELVAFLGTD